jgi:tetratricopeptide (TPR) repeat protein
MEPFVRSRAAAIAIALVTVVMGAIGFLPLFDGPGYESALAAGLVVPATTAILTALQVAAARPSPLDAFGRGLANGALLALVAWLVTMAHGLRAGFCDPIGGSSLFFLGPFAGAQLAGAWGALAGEIAGGFTRKRARRAAASLLGLGGPLVSIGISLARFYTSPIIFAYDPFFGFFSGTLYDTIIDPRGLVSYRMGSAATLLAAFFLVQHLERAANGQLAYRSLGRPGMLVLGALAAVGSVTAVVEGSRLGHWQTASSIAAALGARLSGERCDVIYPRGLPLEEARRFAKECDAHVVAAEAWLEAKGPPRVTAYLFADAEQKGELMGAEGTYIAKPWRREVYVQAGGYPHAVLGHEIAHVMAGSVARGPFEIAGRAFGLLPDPGLIEGIAVAMSPHEGALTPREWAKAMKDLHLLPPLSRLFGLGFLGENSSTAYTTSGAFVGFVKARWGAEVVRRWYGGADLPALTGLSWADLERAFQEDLDKVSLPEAARAQAKARFERPGLFGRRCPHVVDECRRRAEDQRARGDDEGAIASFREALALDPGEAAARVGIARSLVRLGQRDEGKTELEAIVADERFARATRDRAVEELGDMALAEGDGERAMAHYREVMSRTVDEDQLRTLDVKIEAARDPRARAAIVALLIGERGRGPDKVRAAELLGAWAATAPEAGLPEYLLGRQYVSASEFEEAASRLDRALARELSLPRVVAEAERLRLVTACALGDTATARRMYEAYVALPEISEARREAAAALLARCTGAPPPKMGEDRSPPPADEGKNP